MKSKEVTEDNRSVSEKDIEEDFDEGIFDGLSATSD